MTTTFRLLLTAGIGSLALGMATAAAAQPAPAEQPAADDGEQDIQTSSDIVVQGQIGYRNRTDSVEPTLVYGSDYFQRFEPLTAGDALKRVPSVTFLSDVIESDGARLRGLDPGYTQILINGDKVPGSQADRSFFLDRIPAELISRVEIVRSNSARRTGDAMAGTLNIVLRDGYQLDGGYMRVGGLRFDDGKVKPSLGLVYGGAFAGGRLLLGANVQGRYNPKIKSSLRYSESPENDANYTADFENREDQTDTRDGTDYAFNATYGIEFGETKVELTGFYVQTTRTESERSFEYNVATGNPGAYAGSGNAPGLLTDNANVNRIDQENYSVTGKVKQGWSAGETTLKFGYAAFSDNQNETEFELDFDRASPRAEGNLTLTRVLTEEFSAGLDHEIELGDGLQLVFGGYYQDKKYDIDIRTQEDVRTNYTNALRPSWNQFGDNPTRLVTTAFNLAPPTGGFNVIDEGRRDAFALVEGRSGIVSWEAGVRYEHTSVSIKGLPALDRDYGFLLPSASAKIELGDGRITVSGARTVRRPRLDYLAPVLLEAELGDNDLDGNPNLRPESAWGVDLGYEHRIGKMGVAGVNFFYRDVTDLIEVFNTGLPGSEDDPTGDRTFIYQPRNTGSGKVYGVEVDLSTDLRFVGLPDTGIFGNFSYLESDIEDEFGARRFNGQSKYVFNVGFIQNIPSVGAAFGATYRKQGKAFDRNVGEEVTTSYGADLEVFVEKRFGKNFTIRAVGSNLLDGTKDEIFNKFNTRDQQDDRDFDEYEIETERAGPVFQIMARLAF